MIGGLTHQGVLIGWTDTPGVFLIGRDDVDVSVSPGLYEVD